jgi:nucleoporin SEH1
MQTSLIQNAHNDLVTDAAYDFYGVRLATCSLDHRIKVWQLDESDGNWTVVADWKVRGPGSSSYVSRHFHLTETKKKNFSARLTMLR